MKDETSAAGDNTSQADRMMDGRESGSLERRRTMGGESGAIWGEHRIHEHVHVIGERADGVRKVVSIA
jgi:hypothetical protein